MTKPPKPRAYRLDDPDVVTTLADEAPSLKGAGVLVTEEAASLGDLVPVPAAPAPRKAFGWGGLFVSALGGLALLGVGLWAERLVRDLFDVFPALGWTAAVFAALASLGFVGLLVRELSGALRERAIEKLRARIASIVNTPEEATARAAVAELVSLYRARPETARARAAIENLGDAIIDPPDRLAIAERELMTPLDAAAKRAVARAAKQVSLVTAVSPRAIVDVGFVLYAAFRLIRTLAAIYGGRPGFFGFMRLARNVLGHLAVTGGMAAGDSFLQQAMGLGLAARVSAKLGEGALNGLLTARVGLAAMAVCRPMPFTALPQPALADVAGSLIETKDSQAIK